MSNYRYSEYKKQEVRQWKITGWWAENKVWQKRKKHHCAFGVYKWDRWHCRMESCWVGGGRTEKERDKRELERRGLNSFSFTPPSAATSLKDDPSFMPELNRCWTGKKKKKKRNTGDQKKCEVRFPWTSLFKIQFEGIRIGNILCITPLLFLFSVSIEQFASGCEVSGMKIIPSKPEATFSLLQTGEKGEIVVSGSVSVAWEVGSLDSSGQSAIKPSPIWTGVVALVWKNKSGILSCWTKILLQDGGWAPKEKSWESILYVDTGWRCSGYW